MKLGGGRIDAIVVQGENGKLLAHITDDDCDCSDGIYVYIVRRAGLLERIGLRLNTKQARKPKSQQCCDNRTGEATKPF